jgi:hypothetical protein
MTSLRGFAKLRNRKLIAQTAACDSPHARDGDAAYLLAGPLSLLGHSHLSPPNTLPALLDLSLSLTLFSVSVSVHQGDSDQLQIPLRLGQLLTF